MKKFLVSVILCVLCLSFTGCSANVVNGNEVNTLSVPVEARFVPVDKYTIDDGSEFGIDFVTYVDLENGAMWLYTEKFKSGYSTTFVKLTDENNNACIYEQLDELRSEYNYKKE